MEKVAAAAAFELMCARYRYAIRRRLLNRDHPTTRPALVDTGDLRDNGFARQGPFDENHPAVLGPSDARPIPRGGGHAQFHEGTVSAPAAIRVAFVTRPVEIAPSVLPADFARLGEECMALESAGADRIHWDVMDGVFVPNITMGPDIVAALRSHVEIPFEAHLMVVKPDEFAPLYVNAGCSTVMVHAEACTHLHRSLANIRALGARSGVVLNPHTPANTVAHVLDQTDQILVMTVNPGFGGQSYIPLTDKIAELKAMVDSGGHDIDIEIDGGVSASTIGEVAAAGANVFVSGSALFKYDDRAAGVAELKGLAEAARR